MSQIKKPLRCAIYTRKSHEEGLDQAFNSLDAQRESAEAYIGSQKHEGWEPIHTRYDDGGFSGGNTERPALAQLLKAIEYGEVDIVVVYKVDRLSRSLADFSKLIALFDAHTVSFVSVTQQFNTSNSMGRLTLNVLLSFAQFEREVTGERIRDKIAASKKKGMWMGGVPPLGFTVKDRTLVPIKMEVEQVNHIFTGYLENPSLVHLATKLTQRGTTTKAWISAKGNRSGGRRLTPKYLYHILNNPVYIGRVVHKHKTYPGQHPSIIEKALWDRVQETIQRQTKAYRCRTQLPFLLKGKLRHHEGYAMSPSTVKRSGKDKHHGKDRRIRYYVSQKAMKLGYGECDLKAINAQHIERIVETTVLHQIVQSADDKALKVLLMRDKEYRYQTYRRLIREVNLSPDVLNIELDRNALDDLAVALMQTPVPDNTDADSESHTNGDLPVLAKPCYLPQVTQNRTTVMLTLRIQIKKLDGRRFILNEDGTDLVVDASCAPNPAIVQAIGKAHLWRKKIDSGAYANVKAMAKAINLDYAYILKRIHLTTLAPVIQRRALDGTLPATITVRQLVKASQLMDWDRQCTFLRL